MADEMQTETREGPAPLSCFVLRCLCDALCFLAMSCLVLCCFVLPCLVLSLLVLFRLYLSCVLSCCLVCCPSQPNTQQKKKTKELKRLFCMSIRVNDRKQCRTDTRQNPGPLANQIFRHHHKNIKTSTTHTHNQTVKAWTLSLKWCGR